MYKLHNDIIKSSKLLNEGTTLITRIDMHDAKFGKVIYKDVGQIICVPSIIYTG